jgi:hypothetical protein
VIRVVLPQPLRALANTDREVHLDIAAPITIDAVLDALEAGYPALRGTIRDTGTRRRRAFIRYFACEEDLSHDPTDQPLPAAIVSGDEPLIVLGAIAGGEGPLTATRSATVGEGRAATSPRAPAASMRNTPCAH